MNISPKPKRKMFDISRRTATPKLQPKKPESKKAEKNLKEFVKEVEQFEKKEEKYFEKEEKKNKEKKFKLKKRSKIFFGLLGLLFILLIGGFYLANKFLAKAEIKITTKKAEWDYVDSIIASKNISKSNSSSSQKQIPAEIFSATKNYTFSFPATGKKAVENKASGKITIYNAYSSDPQVLVASTRFAAPDGRIFHLTQKTAVPAAKIVSGKIIPSSIDAAVIADGPGPDYNIGPISHFSIPGFKDNPPKYQGFYASSDQPMTGGFIGEKAYPTADDIKQAKQKAETDFKTFIDSALTLQLPSEFKFIDGAKQFNVTKEQVDNNTDEKGNFTIFLEGKSSAIGLREEDLKGLIEGFGENGLGQDFRIKSYNIDYGAGRADFTKGQISFAVNFKGIFEEPIDVDNFTQKILGKSAEDLKAIISSFSNIDKTTVSFWPFWVKSVPDDLGRIKVGVE